MNDGPPAPYAQSFSASGSVSGSSGHSPGPGGSPPNGASRGFKRLIVCCDGTWLDSDSYQSANPITSPPSNITRLSRCILTRSRTGIAQIVFYQAGVGSTGNISGQVISGITGEGVGEHVREAYAFVANNWEDGDEIFVLGFSRGAFTARSVAGLLTNIGVLTKKGLFGLPVIYKDFAHRFSRSYRSPERNIPFPNKPPFRDPDYALEMKRLGLTTLNVKVKAIGVFDTVGSLGIPRIAWLGRVGEKLSAELSDYRFYDTNLDPLIENAFQALALDERRAAFQPAVWEKPDNSRTKLVQCWFPGVHSNVGGGSYPDQEISNITLAWMMSMLEPLIDMDLHYIITQDDLNVEYYRSKGKAVRPWSFGKIYNSLTLKYELGGSISRTPGDYYRIDPRTGGPTNKPLRNTNEYVHASARCRLVQRGPGMDDRGDYNPRALRDFRVRYNDLPGLLSPWYWEDISSGGAEDEGSLILPEAPLRDVEVTLLNLSPKMADYVLNPPERGPPRRRRREGG